MQLLDGKALSQIIQLDLAEKISALKSSGKKIPHLAAVLVGNSGASETYVASKVKTCEKIGFGSALIRRDTNVSEEELLAVVKQLNDDENVSGILV
ncbi:MAG: bifunctional 5,10-methylene-tetrahydrofolate dehydrogenase/5,10-methylene-tetrahydrofolate cyclohydrolase, partial [Chitinophagales bacterium]|nr:bifunctional 5,10-methylene-tetrahydrofolate dehydrogenase/5,10-methylene-tetrahydrofolate cyclohydrolase [Chitinophagales bacterium]